MKSIITPFIEQLIGLIQSKGTNYTDILVQEGQNIRYYAPTGWTDLGVQADMGDVDSFVLSILHKDPEEISEVYLDLATNGALCMGCIISGTRVRVDISLSTYTAPPAEGLVSDDILVGHPSIELCIRKHSPILSLPQLGFPPSLSDLLKKRSGLILITGQTGSGKTSTAASMLQFINEEMQSHIVCIQDPNEFHVENSSAVFSYKEVGRDTPSFSRAVYDSVRQRAEVIFISELRDRETTWQALNASYSSLVICTTHAPNAEEGLARLLNFFPGDDERMVLRMLAGSIACVISQAILPTENREAFKMFFEYIPGKNPLLANGLKSKGQFELLRQGLKDVTEQLLAQKSKDVNDDRNRGLIPMNIRLIQSLAKEEIGFDAAVRASPDPETLVTSWEFAKSERNRRRAEAEKLEKN